MEKAVLIIENDPDTLDVLNEVVSQLNIRTIMATRPPSLAQLAKLNPSLVLVDHWLDNGLGADYCKQIKSDTATRHIPVIIISFIAGLKSIAESSCADEYVSKPFEVGDLQEKILNLGNFPLISTSA